MSKPRSWRHAARSRSTAPGASLVAVQMLLAVVVSLAGMAVRADAQTGPAPIQTVRFSVFSARPISEVAFSPRANAAPLSLQFQPTARSPRYEYRGPMPLRFVDAKSGSVVAEAVIPPAVREVLLLFTAMEPRPSDPGALRYQIAVLDDSAARHGAGGLAIINLSGLALSGTVNNEKVILKPGLNPLLTVGRSAKITLSTVFKNRVYQSYASTAAIGRNERALLILFPPFHPGALEVQSRLLIDQPPGTSPPASTAPPRK